MFEEPWRPTLVHVLSEKRLTCPACGATAMMKTNVKDPVTWPKP